MDKIKQEIITKKMKYMNSESKKRSPWVNLSLFSLTVIAVFILGWFVSTISERRAEALFAYKPKVQLADFEP